MSLRARLLFGLLRLAARFAPTPTVEGLRRLQGPPVAARKPVRGVGFTDDLLAGRDVEVLTPDVPVVGDLLFLHGGAYVAGTRRSVRPILGPVCRESRLRGWSVDYRLAPEHPFPAGLDDTVAAWSALLERGCDPARTLLGGESAGGGLALATALVLRNRGLPMPAALVLLWPWTDLTLSGRSVRENVGKDFLTPALLDLGVAAYGADPADPLASPLLADVSGLPPVFLQVGGRDLVRDDTTRLAARLQAAGVPHAAHVWPGLPHAWVGAGDGLVEARAAVAQTAQWISERLPS